LGSKFQEENISARKRIVEFHNSFFVHFHNLHLFFSKKYDLTKHANYKYLADCDRRNTFDAGEYLSTELKLKANDVYEVIEIDTNKIAPSAM